MSYSARKSAEVFVGEIIENKNKENGKLTAKIKGLERQIKSVRANRDYWKEKAEKLIKENRYLHDYIKDAELEKRLREHTLSVEGEPDLYEDIK